MIYKCLDCGKLIEDYQVKTWKEDRGTWMGRPCIVDEEGCPYCGGTFDETEACSLCDEHFLPSELHGGVCDKCIDSCRDNFELCYKISTDNYIARPVEINCLLSDLFDATHIEAILVEHIRKNCPDIDCSEYIDCEKGWFGANLYKEVNKSEDEKN